MTDTNPLNGTWYSSVESKLNLIVNGTFLEGSFCSTQDPSAGETAVAGSVGTDSNQNFIPIAFTASWPPGHDYGSSVTSYTGQYSNINGQEQIEVIFILANQVESNILWKSTNIAWDVFTRTPPKN